MKQIMNTLALASSLTAGALTFDQQAFTSLDQIFQDSTFMISSTLIDNTGAQWFGTTDGKLYIHSAAGVMPIYYGNSSQPIRSIVQAEDSSIWVGGDALYHYKSGSWEKTKPEEYLFDGWFTHVFHWINGLAPDGDSAVWVAAEGVGALRYDVNKRSWSPYFAQYTTGNMYYSMSTVSKAPNQPAVFSGRVGVQYGVFEADKPVQGVEKITKIIHVDSMDYRTDNILATLQQGPTWWIVTNTGLFIAQRGIQAHKVATSELTQALINGFKAELQPINTQLTPQTTGVLSRSTESKQPNTVNLGVHDLLFAQPVTGSVSVMDLRGRVIANSSVNNQKSVSLGTTIGAGIYLVQLQNLDGTKTSTVTIRK